MQRWLTLIAAFLIAGCTTVAPAGAQGSSPGDAPPLIAGRVALAEGNAQIWRVEEDNAGQWDEAEVNDVVSVGTGLYVGADGRNEIRVGPHTFRLGANSRGGFGQLDYSTSVFNLEYGTLNVRLASPGHGETTDVTVAGLRVELVAPGRYRIDATDQGPMRLTAFEGQATVRSSNNAIGVSAGQAIVVNPGGTGFNFEQAVATGFDQWALARDEQYLQVRSAQYVSPYMTGYEQLDSYGEWTPDVTYGTVWYPRVVPVGWAPYRFGQWRWVRPWGWTWVDQAPWGYAPFHYGRWVTAGGRWGWVPGGYVRRPVWAPALVGFVGSNVSVSIGGPVVGWYPLAPWHRYEPHYRHNPTYVTVINQTIIHRPPPGVPRTINERPGATLVPGPRFREPIHKVVLGAQPKPEQLKPIAPPPLNVAPAPRPSTRKYAEHEGRPGTAMPTPPDGRGAPSSPQQPPRTYPSQAQPPQAQPPVAGYPPTRVRPPIVADPAPGRGVSPQPPLPGTDPAPLGQPPGLKRGQLESRPPVPPPAPPQPERAAPRPHLPSDQIPPGQAKPINPAEPPRFPPGAPPTIRQPPTMAPAARPVQPSPPQRPAQAPAQGAQPAPPRPAPPATAPSAPMPPAPVAAPQPRPQPPPSQKEQVLRAPPDQARGNPVEREAPPPRGKQIDR
jgi:hypothetical protein